MSTPSARECEDEEEVVVGMLERLNSSTLTMQGLEKAYKECQDSHIAKVFLADILFRITKSNLEEFCGEVENLIESLMMKRKEIEEEEEAIVADPREANGTYEDLYIGSIVDWTEGGVEVVPSTAPPILRCFLSIAYTLAHAHANPCHSEMGMGSDAILTWRELQAVALRFLSISRPQVAHALPVIRCLRRKPLLDCRGLSADERAKLAKFDKKWERLCHLYPVVNMLADPALVLVEPVGGGGLPPHVAGVIAAISTAANNPLPSGGAPPAHVADVMGNFTHLFQVPSMDDARTFAAMLRVQLADATGGGGAGPAVRIVSLNAPPATLRLY